MPLSHDSANTAIHQEAVMAHVWVLLALGHLKMKTAFYYESVSSLLSEPSCPLSGILTVSCPLSETWIVSCPLSETWTVSSLLSETWTVSCPLNGILTVSCPLSGILTVSCPLSEIWIVSFLASEMTPSSHVCLVVGWRLMTFQLF